jgi:hypothetical protein
LRAERVTARTTPCFERQHGEGRRARSLATWLPVGQRRIRALSLDHRLAMINLFHELVRAGVLLSYGTKVIE